MNKLKAFLIFLQQIFKNLISFRGNLEIIETFASNSLLSF